MNWSKTGAKLPKNCALGQTGVVNDARDRVYLFNRSEHPLIVLDHDGIFVTSWGEGIPTSAHGMFIDQRENLDLPVMNSHVVLGPFHRPTDVAISRTGDVYISDCYGNARVHRFTADGRLEKSWGAPGRSAPGEFHVPHGVWVHTDGRIFVADREKQPHPSLFTGG